MAKNPLPTLIRLAQMQLDERRKVLNALYVRDEAYLAQIAAIQLQVKQESEQAHLATEGGLTHGAFIQASLQRCVQIEELRQKLGAEITAAQDLLRQSFEVLKRYEIAHEARMNRAVSAQKLKETIHMDEVGSQRNQATHSDGSKQ